MKIYRVGGSVRDRLLYGENRGDEDFVVVGAKEDEFVRRYPTAQKVGKSFPVFLVNGKEFAFARKEWKNDPGHRGFSIIADPDVTLEEDLKRRDLTINAIAEDMETGELVDPFGGRNDIKNRVIRHVSPAFSEDPLRAYRVARFSAQLPDFSVDASTISLMKTLKSELSFLSAERVWSETARALCQPAPDRFFRILDTTDLLDIHFPELACLKYVPAGPAKYHSEGSALEHSLQVLSAVEYKHPVVRFAALMHDIGKCKTPPEQWPSHYRHDQLGVSQFEAFSTRMKISKQYQTAGKMAIRYHMKAGLIFELRAAKAVDLLMTLRRFPVDGVRGFFSIVAADAHRPLSDYEEAFRWETAIKSVHLDKNISNNGRKNGELLKSLRVDMLKKTKNNSVSHEGESV